MPYWRLSSVYFFYFAVVGALSPFWGLYLEHLQFSPADIGFLSAIPMLTKIAAPNVWGLLADYSGRRLAVIRFGAAGACICFLGVFFHSGLVWLAVVISAYTFFWNAILSQFEVITLSHLADKAHEYSRVRLWGSVGFIVAVAGLGVFFDYASVAFLPLIIFCFLLGIFITSLSLPATSQGAGQAAGRNFLRALGSWPVVVFFLVMLLLQLSHGVYYTFYSIYLEQLNYSRSFIGGMWAIGVLAEIILFLQMPRLLRLFNATGLLILTLSVTAVRWLLIGWMADSLLWLVLAQLLHAFTFGAAHALSVEFVRLRFGRQAQGQGQALYSALCFGGGNALGAYFSGLLWEVNPQAAFLLAVLVTVAALALAVLASRRTNLFANRVEMA